MERSVFVSSVEGMKGIRDVNRYSRIYFGNEFCENLLPSGPVMRKVLQYASGNSLDFTFVTPYLTDAGIKRLRPLMRFLSAKECEVVVNDWGILELVRDHSLEPVLGRLLTKMKKGPRLMNIIDKVPDGLVDYYSRSNVEVPVFQKFLKKNGIRRVEFDNVLQGIRSGLEGSGLSASVYHPHVYLTTTRRCPINSSDVFGMGKKIGIFACKKECQKYTVTLRNDNVPVKLLLKGNTYFFRNERVPKNLKGLGVDRLVYMPHVPV